MKKREQTTAPKETKEQQKHRFKVLNENAELLDKARKGNVKAQKHLQALIDQTEIDPEWLIEDPEPEPKRQDLKVQDMPNVTTIVSILGDCLKITMADDNDYYISVDFIKINVVKRVSYNVIHNELILILNETTGSVEEVQTKVLNGNGHPTGGIRYATYGKTGPFKVVLVGTDSIRLFLEKWLGVKKLTDADFEGFIEHEKAEKKMQDKIAEMKKKDEDAKAEKEKGKASKIVDMHGQPANKED